MKTLRVKVCGMTDVSNVEAICRFHPDYIGFIFYSKSVRYVGKTPDHALFSSVPATIHKTAVFVNEYYEKILELTGRYGIGTVQLHGMEPPETCNALRLSGKRVIKAIPGNQIADRKLVEEYAQVSDYLLFDTPVISHGGSGRKFNWSNLKELQSRIPFFLSGGITLDDADAIRKLNYRNFFAVDINSRFETEPGIKDPEMTGLFIKRMKNGEAEEL